MRNLTEHAPATLLVIGMLVGVLATPAFAATKLRVITTTEDLASITRAIGGDRVEVKALCRGYQDPHYVDAKPSYMVQLKRADLFIAVGRDLEVSWAPGLLRGSRNRKILPGAAGYVDASAGLEMLEVPASVSRAQGDVHPLGNPHYWLDPANGAQIAMTIRDALSRVMPEDDAFLNKNAAAFSERLEQSIVRWKAKAKALGLSGTKVIAYHRTWTYFAKAFDFEVVDYIEPRPGIPPSPNHIRDLFARIEQGDVRMILMEPFFDSRLPDKISKRAGVPLVVIPTSVGAEKEIESFFDLFDYQLDLIGRAIKDDG